MKLLNKFFESGKTIENKALSVLVAVALATSMVSVAAFAEINNSLQAQEQISALQEKAASEAASGGDGADATTHSATAGSEEAAEVAETGETAGQQEATAEVDTAVIDLDYTTGHVSLNYPKDQPLSQGATYITVKQGQDFTFQAFENEGYVIDDVVLRVNGAEQDLAPDAGTTDTYTVPAALATSATDIVIKSSEDASAPAEDASATAITEGTVVEEGTNAAQDVINNEAEGDQEGAIDEGSQGAVDEGDQPAADEQPATDDQLAASDENSSNATNVEENEGATEGDENAFAEGGQGGAQAPEAAEGARPTPAAPEATDGLTAGDEGVDEGDAASEEAAGNSAGVETGTVDVTADVSSPAFEGYAYVNYNGRNVVVKVTAGEGVVPEGTTVNATLVTNSVVTKAIESVVESTGKVAESTMVVDVTLVKDGKEVQPDGALNVCFFNTGLEGDGYGVYKVSDDASTVETIAAPRQTDAECVSFDTDHFSLYGVATTSDGVATVAATDYDYTTTVGNTVKISTNNSNGNTHSWSSSDTSVATIAASAASYATVKGVSTGVVTITHKWNTGGWWSSWKTETFTVLVEKGASPTAISISGSSKVEEYSTIDLTAKFTPSNASGTVSWSSSDTSVATVDANGTVTGVKAGTVTITARTLGENDQVISAEKTITVTEKDILTGNQAAYIYTQAYSNDGVTIEGLSLNATGAWNNIGYITNAGLPSNYSTYTDGAVQEDLTKALSNAVYSGKLAITYDGGNEAFAKQAIENGLLNFGPTSAFGVKRVSSGAGPWITNNANTWHVDTVMNVYALVGVDSFTYDGQAAGSDAHPAKPTLEINGSTYDLEPTLTYYDVNGKEIAAPKDAGTYTVKSVWTIGECKITAQGSFTISKRDVTLTSATNSKEYDGTALTNDAITVGGNGWAEGEGATYDVTGSQTNVGSSSNSFTYNLNDGTNADNYNITTSEGTLTVTNRDAKYEITVTANSSFTTYDGKSHEAKGLVTDKFQIGDTTFTVSGLSTSNPSQTNAGEYANVITGTAKVTDQNGTDVTDQFKVNQQNGKLTIDKKAITITANSAEKKYDGAPLNASGYTASGVVSGQNLSATVKGQQTAPGTSAATIASYTIKSGTTDVTANYDVTLIPGTLTVTNAAAQFAITVKGNSATATYDGKEHAATGFTVNGAALGEDGSFTYNGITYKLTGLTSANPNQKNAGTYANTVTGTAKIVDEAGNDVSSQFAVKVTPGTLTINKANVTLKSADLSKEYDGSPLTNGTTALAVEQGFAEGEGATYAFSGSQTKVGSSANAFTYTLNAGTLASNYNITTQNGTLKVINRTSKYEVTVVAKSATATYDGQEHSATGVVTNQFLFGTTTFTVEGLTTEDPAKTDAGTYDNKVTGTWVVKDDKGNDVTDQFNVTTQDGTLTINKANVTLKSASLSKAYDGDALVNGDTALAENSGWIGEEGVDVAFSGSQLLVGTSPNSFTYAAKAGTNLDNYNISRSEGQLTVTNPEAAIEVTVTGKSLDTTYNGQDQSVSGFEDETERGIAVTAANGKTYYITGLTSSATGKNVSDSVASIAVEGTAVVKDALGNDVSKLFDVKVVNGHLTIGKKDVTLTSASLEKEYDGTALTNGTAALATETGWVEGEGATYNFSGSRTLVGSSDNSFDYSLKTGTLAENYNITATPGKLTVTNRTAKYQVSVEANSGTYDYDATERSATGLKTTEFTIDGNKYTVSGLSTSDPAKTNAGSYTNSITGTPVVTDANGNDVTDQFNVSTIDGTLTINKVKATITAKSASKTYDGTALTESGSDWSGFVGNNFDGLNWVTTGSQTNAGSSPNALVVNGTTYTEGATISTTNYEVTLAPGTLTVNPSGEEVVVNLKAKSLETTYDGKAHSVSGYEFVSASTDKYTADDFSATGVQTIEQTNAGIYANDLTGVTFTNNNANFTNVKFVVEAGNLVINRGTVTITANAAEKFYGDADPEFSATVSGLLEGDTVNYKVTRTDAGNDTVGTHAGVLAVVDYPTDLQNYTIKVVPADFTVKQKDVSAYTTSVTETGWKYDGTTKNAPVAQVAEGETVVTDSTLSAPTFTYEKQNGETWSAIEGTPVDAGTYRVTATWAASTNYPEFKATSEAFEVTKRDVTLTSATDQKVYDGKALTNANVTVDGDGFVAGEGATYDVKGTQTEVGTSDNTFSYELTSATKADNYNITTSEGTLKVTEKAITGQDFVINTPENVVYNGTEQKWAPTVADGGKALAPTTDYTVSYSEDLTNVGTVTVTITGAGNYSGTVIRTYEITKAPLTITTGSGSKTYDGSALTADGSIEGLVNGETVDFSATGSQTDVGSSSNTYSLAWTGTAREGNYQITENLGTLTVIQPSAAEVRAEVAATGWVYDGTFHEGAITSSSDSTATVAYSYEKQDGTNWVAVDGQPTGAGTYRVTANWPATQNYPAVSATAEFTIAKATLTVTTAQTKPYNGQEQTMTFPASVEGTGSDISATTEDGAEYTVTGLVKGETLTLTASVSGTNQGSYPYSDGAEWAVDGNQDNYNVSVSGTLTIDGPEYADRDLYMYATLKATNGGTVSGPADKNGWYTLGYVGGVNLPESTIAAKLYGSGNALDQFKATATDAIENNTINRYQGKDWFYDSKLFDAVDWNGPAAYSENTGSPTGYSCGPQWRIHGTVTFNPLVSINDWTYDGVSAADKVSSSVNAAGADDVKFSDVTYTWKDASGNTLGEAPKDAGTYRVVASWTVDGTNVQVNSAEKTFTISKREVTLTSEGGQKVYDGSALTNETINVTGDGFVSSDGVSYKATGSQTEVGTSKNTIEVTASDSVLANYTITKVEGTLEVTAFAETVVVTIAENSGNATYNGQEHSVTGYTIKSVSNELYGTTETAANNFTFNGTAEVKGTNAGTYDMALVPTNFMNTNTNFTNVTFVIEDGTLVVSPRTVTLASESAEKTYDGTALTNSTVTVGGEGFVEGQGASYTVTGAQTVPGSSSNAFTYALNENTLASNYTITTSTGLLTVNSTSGQYATLTLVANSSTGNAYDGQAHSAKGVEAYKFTVNGVEYTVSNYSTTDPEQTNAGTYANTVTIIGAKVTDPAGNDVTSEFTLAKTDGQLVIAKRDVAVKSADLTKAYDGSALVNGDAPLAYTGSFVAGEGITPTFTGSQTVKGSSENSYTYAANEGTNLGNYNFSAEFGTLTVNDAEAPFQITVKANSASVDEYDGQYHSAKGIEADTFVINNHTYKVSGLTTSDPTAKDAGSYANNITGTAKVTDENGNDVTDQFSVSTENGGLTIGARTVTLTSASDSKTYDGTALTNGEVTVGGKGFVEGEGATYNVTGSQTNVGSSGNTFTYALNEGTLASNYSISTTEGTLSVSAYTDEVVVTITGGSATTTYDGTEQSVTGYAVSISNNLYTAADFSAPAQDSEAATAKGTNAGTYQMGLGESSFANTSNNFTNVKFVVNNGSLTIQQRAIEVTGGYAEKMYDGTKLSAADIAYYVTDVAYVTEGTLEAGATVTGTNVGETGPDVSSVATELTSVTIMANGTDVTSNYSITKKNGYITILPVLAEVTVTVTENSGSATYDGNEKSVEGYTVTSIEQSGSATTLFSENDFTFNGTAKATGTNAGTYDMGVLASDFAKTTNNFSNVKFVVVDGQLTINPRAVTLTSASDEKIYDGDALTNGNVTVSGEGFVDGQGATYDVTGSQTIPGSSENSFTYSLNDGTSADNYTITKQNGTLTVNNRDAKYEITVVANSAEATYDGEEHIATGIVTNTFTVGENTYTVSGLETTGTAQTNAGTYANNITGTAVVRDADGNDVTNQFAVHTQDGSLVINPRAVTLTSASDSKVYDGTALTNNTVNAEGFVAGQGATYSVTGTITNVGTADNAFTYTLNENTLAGNYTISTKFGTLEVTPVTDEVVVTIAGNNATKLYNGEEQSVTGYTFASSSDLYTAANVQFTGNATAKGINAGTYAMGLTAGNFSNTSANFTNVRFEVVDGALTINPRAITVAGGYSSKIYDGTSLDAADSTHYAGNMYTVTGETLENQTVSATMVGTYGPNVGGTTSDVTNVKVTGVNGADVTSNYTITTETGALVIGPVLNKVTVTVNAASGTEKYDGTEKSASGYTATSDNALYEATTDNFTFSGTSEVKGTNAGSYKMGMSAFDFKNTNANFSNVEFVVNDGTLTIEKRNVTLTSATAEKVYDGTALTNGEVAVGGDGFAEGQGASYSVTGSQTVVGNSENKFGYTLNEGTDAANYNITTENGTLTVTSREAKYEITVVANSATATYDGAKHSASGFETLDFTVDGNAYKVSGLYTTSPNETNAGTYANNITGNAIVTDKDGNDVTSEFTVHTTSGTLTIAKRNVTLTSASDQKVYDGTALTNSNVVVAGAGFVEGEGATYNVTGSQTTVGSSANAFTYTLNSGTLEGNYNITKAEGTLEVTALTSEVVVTVTENSGNATYDGAEHTVTGYTVTSISNPLYTANDFTFGGTAEAKGTDAGTYDMNVRASDFANTNNNFTNVKFVVNDGTLTIAKRNVTLTSATDAKVYDGTALTNGNVTVGGDGFVEGQGATYAVTGSQTTVGSSSNAFTYSLNENTGAGNYNITTAEGTLTVSPVVAEVVVTIAGNNNTLTYDGTEKAATGYTVTSISNPLYTTADFSFSGTAEAKGTDAGSYAMGLASSNFANTNGNFSNVRFVVTDGTLTINPRTVTLISATATKQYDGTALTNKSVAVGGDGFAAGEGATYNVMGTRTVVGASENTFTYTLNAGTKATNYSITTVNGTLTVTSRDAKYAITVEANSGSATYDGGEHSTTGLKTTTFEVEGQTYTVSGLSTTDPTKVDAGTYPNNITGTAVVRDADGNDVTSEFTVATTNGSLDIAKRDVTLTSASGTKVYDGQALTNDEVTAVGFVEGEGASYEVTGSQTTIGSSKNAFAYTLNSNTKAGNYNITKSEGTLEVAALTDEVVVTITENSATLTYDGTEHSVVGYTVTSISNPLYTSADFNFNGSAKVEGTGAGTYDMQLQASNFANTNPNFGNVRFEIVDGALTINKRNVTLTSATDEKNFDGTALTNNNVAVSGDGFAAGEGATYSVTGTQTVVGTTENTFTYGLNANTDANNYNITTVNGALTVKPMVAEVVVTIAENSGVETYDGTEKTVSGYTVKSISSALYSEADFSFNGTAEVKGTDAGTYNMGLEAANFTNNNTTFSNVRFVIEDGTLVINKRNVTLTSATASKEYDGTALTNGEVTVAGDGFAEGQGASYDVTGSQTGLGSSKNTFTYSLDEGTNAANYNISTSEGTLTVTNRGTQYEVTVTANSSTVTYDGTEKGVTGVETYEFTLNGVTYTVSGLATENPKGTDAGTYTNDITGTPVVTDQNGNVVTSEFKVNTVNGALTINPRNVTLTSASGSKVFDGTALTNNGVEVGGDGFAAGEGATYNVTGAQTAVGESSNTFGYTLNSNTKAANYNITTSEGTLAVTPVIDEVVVTIKANAGMFTYNGEDQTVSGYSFSSNNALYADLASNYMYAGTGSTTVKDAGTYQTGFAQGDFANINSNFSNVTFVVENADVVVNPATLTVTTPSAEKTYDGTPLTAEGSISGFVAGESATFTTTGTRTAVGSVTNTYAIDWNGTAKQSNYTVVENLGSLTVSEYAETITVTTTGTTATYDGTAHGATVEVTGLPAGYTVETAESSATATNVSDGTVSATADKLVIKNAEGEDVTAKLAINKVDSTITITPAKLTVTTPSDTKVYDGSALTAEGSISGFVNNETADFTTTGTQTSVGSSTNTYEIAWTGSAKQSNYDIDAALGTLTVTENADEIVATVTGGEFTYDGSAHGATVSVSTLPAGYTLESALSNATATDVTTTPVEANVDTLVIRNAQGVDVTSELNIRRVPSTISVKPAQLYVTTPDASKTYDGTALTAAGSISGFVAGESAEFTTTGTQTAVGSSANGYQIVWNGTAKQSNYTIIETLGTLTVTEAPVTPAPNPTPSTPSTPSDTTTPTTPVTPTTPSTPVTPTTPANPAATNGLTVGGATTLPEPLNTIVETLEDAVTPLAEAIGGNNEEQIGDDETPLANQENHVLCWVHYYIALGIIVTLVYGAVIIARRMNFSRKLQGYEDDSMGKPKNDQKQGGGKTATTPASPSIAEPTMSAGTEA